MAGLDCWLARADQVYGHLAFGQLGGAQFDAASAVVAAPAVAATSADVATSAVAAVPVVGAGDVGQWARLHLQLAACGKGFGYLAVREEQKLRSNSRSSTALLLLLWWWTW